MATSVKKNSIFKQASSDYNRNFSRVAKLHKYWSRKPWYIIGNYIKKYSKKESLVLDPFCGSGIIGLESILANRNFIGYDLNPFAIFLANTTMDTKQDIGRLREVFNHLEDEISADLLDPYRYKNNQFILYTIAGPKNSNDYNAVVSDRFFKNKIKVKTTKRYLQPKIDNLSAISFPDKDFPKAFYKDRFSYKGISKVSDMFTKRNLRSLALLNEAINLLDDDVSHIFKLAFTNTLLHVSKLKSEGVRPLGVNNYWVPDDYIEENVWWRYKDRFNNILSALEVINQRAENGPVGSYELNNESSLVLNKVSSESIDYIITDPPYGDTIQYSELSFIWNCWLESDFETENEVIINPKQNKGVNEYTEQLVSFISEMNRVLKKDKYFTLAFQNKDVGIWTTLAEIIHSHGMKIVDISSYAVLGSPYNKNWSKFSPKSDFYVTFKKTKSGRPGKVIKNNSFSAEEIALEVLKKVEIVEMDVFDLNKAYDLFISIILEEIFKGRTPDENIKKLNVKKIIAIFTNLLK